MRTLFVIATCIVSSALGQGVPPQQPQTPPVAWTEHYRKATISFGRVLSVQGVKTFDPIGTGLVVCSDSTHAFIVTAKHVFYDPEKSWFPASLAVRFSNEESQSLTEQLGSAITLANEKQEVYWSSLDDGSDIAAIAAPKLLFGKLTDCVGFQDFGTAEDVYDGATVFTFGFPASGGVLTGPNGLVRAITRSGIIAWTDPKGALENPLLLDSNVLPGNSGGPAFKVPIGVGRTGSFEVGGRVAFLGIVTAALDSPVHIGDKPMQVQLPGSLKAEQAGVVGVGARSC